MADYRQIHTHIWSDRWFISQSHEAKFLFIYLFSNGRASVCGLYELPLSVIAFETGMEIDDIRAILSSFSQDGKVSYDYKAEVVWVRNMMKYQSSSSPKLQARIKADIKAVPECDLKTEYLNGKSKEDTVSVGYTSGSDTPLSVSVSNLSQSQSQGGGVGEGKSEAMKSYEQNIGALTPMIAEQITDLETEYGPDWVVASFGECVTHEARNLKYAAACLKRWKREGFKSQKQGAKPATSDPPRQSRAAVALAALQAYDASE